MLVAEGSHAIGVGHQAPKTTLSLCVQDLVLGFGLMRLDKRVY